MSVSFQTLKITSVVKKHLDNLEKEILSIAPSLQNTPIRSIYIGGGSPSILTSQQIEYLFDLLYSNFNIPQTTRIIFESLPNLITEEKIKVLKKVNITELALGVQSLDDEVIKKNRRLQTRKHVVDVTNLSKKYNIPSITYDIMTGLPYQSKESAIETIYDAISLNPDAILVNPFIPVIQCDFTIEGNFFSKQQQEDRNEISFEVKKILVESGYKQTCQGFRKKWDETDEKYNYETQETESVIGFGYGAFSHAYGNLKYVNVGKFEDFAKQFPQGAFVEDTNRNFEHTIRKKLLPNNYNIKSYIGLKLNKKEEMRTYVYSNMENFSLEKFRKRFNENFLYVFKSQVVLLRRLNLIKIQNDKIMFKDVSKDVINLCKTFFINKEYIERMIKNFNEEYDINRDYKRELEKLSSV